MNRTRRGAFSSSSVFLREQVWLEAAPCIKQGTEGGAGVVADGGEDALRRGRDAKSLISGASDFDCSLRSPTFVLLSTLIPLFTITSSGAIGDREST